MKIVDNQEIINIFNLLNKSGLKYILMRNINNALPFSLGIGQDIDLLVSKEEKKVLVRFFHKNQYETIDHPFKNDIFLYGVDKFEFKYNDNNNILFDLSFQLAVRSLYTGQWIPLDLIIQKSAWQNRRFQQVNETFGYWALGYEDEFVTLVARSVFDKKEFQSGYIKRLEELFPKIDADDVAKKLNKVFFKYAPHLLKQVEQKKYHNIVENYLTFKEY